MPQAVVSKSELAVRLGLSNGRITQFVRAGMPVRADGKIDLDAALAWIAETRQGKANYTDRGVHLVTAPPPTSDATPPMSYTEARTMRERALAGLAQLKLEIERGNLVAVDSVKRDWVSTLTDLRGRLLAVPARVAAALPHLSPGDVAMFAQELRQALQEASDADMA